MYPLEVHPIVCLVPLHVTERTLPHGSPASRRLPDVLAHVLRTAYGIDARWEPQFIAVEEGWGYAVTVAGAETTDPETLLARAGGDYVVYGLLDLDGLYVRVELRVYSRSHETVTAQPVLRGSAATVLHDLPRLAEEVAAAVSGGAERLTMHPTRLGLTTIWTAFEYYCVALDYRNGAQHSQWTAERVLDLISRALESDPTFELAMDVGLEVAHAIRRRESLEYCLEVVNGLARRAPALPAPAYFRAELYREMGRGEEAEREEVRARVLERELGEPPGGE